MTPTTPRPASFSLIRLAQLKSCCCALFTLLLCLTLGLSQAYAGSDSALEQLRQAKNAVAHSKPDKALGLLSSVLSQDPSLADAYYWQGEAYELKGDDSAAQKAYQQFVLKLGNRTPSDPEMLLKLRRRGLF